MITALLLLAAAPSAEAEALGIRLARTGTLAALLPMAVAKDTEELIAKTRDLTPAEQAQLRAMAQETGRAGMEKIFAAEGKAYAAALSVEDLRALVAAAESAPARRMRAAMPQVIATTVKTVDGMDFKKDAMAAFCAKTGKGCVK